MRPINSLLFLIILIFTQSIHAATPIEKGVYGLTANASYRKTEQTDFGKSKSFGLNPGLMFYFNNRIGLGVNLSYYRRSVDNYSGVNFTRPAYTISGYDLSTRFRYYLTAAKPLPFVELGYGIGVSTFKDERTSNDSDSTTYNAAVGMDFFIARNIALEPAIRYYRSKYKNPVRADWNSKYTAIGIGINMFIY